MNKKVFLGLFAATGMLLATSCSQDELEVPQSGNEAQVTFTLGLEGGHATRAISDGSGVNKLVYAVYKRSATSGVYELQPAVGSKNSQFVKNDFTSGDNVSIPLAKGQTYRVAFWAQNSKCNAYNTDNLTAVSVDYEDVNNNETRDAFFKTVEFTVEGSKTINVVLTRPFAQINVGVTAEDWEAAIASGIEIKESEVTIDNAATAINLLTGEVSGEQVVSYALNAIPKETLEAETDNTKDGKEQYHWLSMSYILVNETGDQDADSDSTLGDAQTTLDGLSYTFAPESGNNITFENGLNSVPVQRNYRTNIVGKILTGDIKFNITVDPVYDGEHIYPDGTVDDLQLAAAYGGTITLAEDIVLEDVLNITSELVINLNGKTISGDFSDKAKTVINNTGKLTLIGGEIKNTATNGAAVITNSGKLVLKDVTINGAPIGTEGYPSYAVSSSGELTIEEGTTISSDRGAIYLQNGANVTINGGNIKVTNALGTRILTAHVIYAYGYDSKLTINNGNFEMAYEAQGNTGASVICPVGATIKVFNGEFSYAGVQGNQSGIFQNYMGYRAPVDVYGGTYNDNTVTKSGNLAEGYKAIEKDGKWYVVPEEVDAVAGSAAEISTALKEANAVVYVYPTEDGSSYKLEGKLSLAEGVKLIGAGDEPVALFNDWGSNAFANQAHFTNTHIENVYFSNNLVIDAGIANGNVTFKGCVFGGDLAHQGVHFDSGNGTITFDDCTFVGRNMFGSSLENVIFNNCKFENKKSSQTGADKWTGVNMWGKYEFNNCEFDTEATCNVKCDGVIADFNNCFYSNGKDIKEVISNSPEYTCTITVDGIVVGGYATTEILNKKGVTYTGDFFENSIDNALYFKNWILEGDATIKVDGITYGAIILENVKGNLNGDAIVINNDNNSVMILANCDFTLAEGKKLIKSTNKIYQVFMTDITINGVKLTQDNAAQYLENVGWFQVVEEI